AYEDITEAIYGDPEFLVGRMEAMTEIAVRYAQEIERRGPDVLMLVDGTSQTLGPDHYRRFSFPYTKAVVEALRTPAILHVCGNPTPILGQMAETGVEGLSIDHPIDTGHAFKATGGKVALVGKISPQTLCIGSKEEIVAETETSLREGMHVIAPGCGILPQTPLANLRAYIERVRNWQG
ncbi:MAG: hypothetical protein F9K51_06950, partial [Candidatus Dadabacteria bacterium]